MVDSGDIGSRHVRPRLHTQTQAHPTDPLPPSQIQHLTPPYPSIEQNLLTAHFQNPPPHLTRTIHQPPPPFAQPLHYLLPSQPLPPPQNPLPLHFHLHGNPPPHPTQTIHQQPPPPPMHSFYQRLRYLPPSQPLPPPHFHLHGNPPLHPTQTIHQPPPPPPLHSFSQPLQYLPPSQPLPPPLPPLPPYPQPRFLVACSNWIAGFEPDNLNQLTRQSFETHLARPDPDTLAFHALFALDENFENIRRKTRVSHKEKKDRLAEFRKVIKGRPPLASAIHTTYRDLKRPYRVIDWNLVNVDDPTDWNAVKEEFHHFISMYEIHGVPIGYDLLIYGLVSYVLHDAGINLTKDPATLFQKYGLYPHTPSMPNCFTEAGVLDRSFTEEDLSAVFYAEGIILAPTFAFSLLSTKPQVAVGGVQAPGGGVQAPVGGGQAPLVIGGGAQRFHRLLSDIKWTYRYNAGTKTIDLRTLALRPFQWPFQNVLIPSHRDRQSLGGR